MKSTRFACVAVTSALLCLPSVLSAHGGQYRGPGDTVPPGGGGGGGKTGSPGGPTTPGPGGPTTPGPGGPNTPGPQTPSAPTGAGPRSGPTTGGPRGVEIGDDLAQWQFWWEFNKDPFLQLKKKIQASAPVSGADDFEIGRGLRGEKSDTLKPVGSDLKSAITALKEALEDPSSNRDIVSSCMVALAKIGNDVSILPLFKKFLPDSDQEKSETAALAMGIAALTDAIPDLVSLAKDDAEGRKLVGKSEVNFRTRAFACYGLGLIAHATTDNAIKTKVLDAVKAILSNSSENRRDVLIAALNAIRLLRPDSSTTEGQALQGQAIEFLAGYLDRKDVFAQIQSHAISAIANLVGRNDTKGTLKQRILAVLEDRKQKDWMHQSAILALGQMATPEDEKICEAIRDYAQKGKNDQGRYFSCTALGQIGGEKNRDFLRGRLVQGRTQTIQKPWLSLGLAIMDYQAREADKAREIDSTASDIARQLKNTKTPLPAAGMAIALGVMRDKDSGDLVLERMIKSKNDDEPAGYFAVALGLMNFQEAKEEINAMLEKAARRDKLLTQCAIALGLLGDKEVGLRLVGRLKEKNPVAVFSAVAQALGFIGDRRSLSGLMELLGNKQLQPLNRAFAAVALGLVCDKELLPWNSKISVNINYRANVETLTGNGGTGILDIL